MSGVILTHPRGALPDRCYMVSQIMGRWMRVWRGGDLTEARRVANEWGKWEYAMHPGDKRLIERETPSPHVAIPDEQQADRETT